MTRRCSSSSTCSYVITPPRSNEHAADSIAFVSSRHTFISQPVRHPQDSFIRVVANEDGCLSRNEHWISRVCRYGCSVDSAAEVIHADELRQADSPWPVVGQV